MKNIWDKHRGKIIAVVIIAAVLTAAFFWGGNYSKNTDVEAPAAAVRSPEPTPDSSPQSTESDPSVAEPQVSSTSAAPSASVSPKSPAKVSKNAASPVPSINAEPAEDSSANVNKTQETCTLSVDCSTILVNMNLLDKAKWNLVPKDGVIFATKTVSFYGGESVFNVLSREMKKAGIQMEFKNTPMYNSAYIEGIDNIYEFDAGDLSGWVYEVNGWFPNYGCSRYQLKDGDVVKWLYTCDLGKDVGGNNSTGS